MLKVNRVTEKIGFQPEKYAEFPKKTNKKKRRCLSASIIITGYTHETEEIYGKYARKLEVYGR